jgi:hypothetical protein
VGPSSLGHSKWDFATTTYLYDQPTNLPLNPPILRVALLTICCAEQDFQLRIPREEARLLEKQVKKAVKAMSPHLKAVTCGSYR